MRAAIVGPYPPNRNRIVGGVEAVVSYLAEELSKYRNVELHIVSCLPDIRSEMVRRSEGMTIHFLPATRRFATLTQNRLDVRRIAKKIGEIGPDIVHAHDAIPYGGGALESGYPSVLTVHSITRKDWGSNPGLRNRLKAVLGARYANRIINRSRDIIACTPYVLEEYGSLISGHVYSIEYPIHRRFYQVESNSVPNRLLLAAKVIPRKRVLELVESVGIIRHSFPDIELRIAGDTSADPAYVRSVLDYIGENNLQGNVRFLGSLDEQAILNEYSSCSLVVLASIQETSPMAIHQAMAAGKAVISTRVCGVPYLVEDGKTGLMVECGDTSGFARAVLSLLNDDRKREEMGRQARIVAQRFRSDVIARKTLEVYEGVLNVD